MKTLDKPPRRTRTGIREARLLAAFAAGIALGILQLAAHGSEAATVDE